MFSHNSEFALACLYFAGALLAMICCIVIAPSALKPVAMFGTTVFITASFMRSCAQPLFARERWRRASRITSLLIPIPFFLCLLSQSLVTVRHEEAEQPLAQIINVCEEATYLREAESCERRGEYYEAESYYRRWIAVRQRLHPSECLDGVLARILDLQGCHSEAERYYSSYEKHTAESLRQKQRAEEAATRVAKGDVYYPPLPTDPAEMTGSFPHGSVVLADGRLLRILQTISREKALHEFDFAGSVLKCADLPASQLGRRLTILDLRPVIKDYRKAEEQDKIAEEEPPAPKSEAEADVTIITSVECAGCVLEAPEMRRYLSKIGRDKALVEFDFADYYFPRNGARFVREDYAVSPLSGYKNIACVRDLIPRQIAIIHKKEYEKLKKLSGL
jgi:tetratricopeptide (TPR) repeat protein